MLLLVILLLAVPIRYDIKVRYKDEVRAIGKVHWLLRLIQAVVQWKKDKGLLKIKLAGFTLKRMSLGGSKADKPEEKPAEQTAAEAAEEDDEYAEAYLAAASVSEMQKPAAEAAKPAAKPESTGSGLTAEKKEETEHKAEKPVSEEKLEEAAKNETPADSEAAGAEEEPKESFTEKVGKAADKACAKLDELEEKLRKVEDFLDDRRNQKTIELIKKQLKRAGKHLLPTHFLLKGELGLKDPAQTGKIIGWTYALYGIYGDRVQMNGVYDHEVMDFYAELGGRLRLGVFVEIAVRLLLNRNFRRWLKFFLHKGKASSAAPEAAAET